MPEGAAWRPRRPGRGPERAGPGSLLTSFSSGRTPTCGCRVPAGTAGRARGPQRPRPPPAFEGVFLKTARIQGASEREFVAYLKGVGDTRWFSVSFFPSCFLWALSCGNRLWNTQHCDQAFNDIGESVRSLSYANGLWCFYKGEAH